MELIIVCFYEYVLVIPFFGGSFTRILEVFLVLDILINKKTFSNTGKLIVVLIYGLMLLVSAVSFSAFIGILINVFLIYFVWLDIKDSQHNRNYALFVLAIASIFAGIYGIINNSGGASFFGLRHNGTFKDPNYSAFIYIIGFFSAACCSKFNKLFKISLCIASFGFLLSTLSMAGLLSFFIVFLVFIFSRLKRKAIFICLLLIFFAIVLLNFDLPTYFPGYNVQQRVLHVLNQFQTGNIDSATSNRSYIASAYWNEFWTNGSVIQQLFGGRNTMEGSYRNYMYSIANNVSHNTYIDILMMSGILGFIFFTFIALAGVIKYLCQGKKDITITALALFKIALLVDSFTLSMYTLDYHSFFILI